LKSALALRARDQKNVQIPKCAGGHSSANTVAEARRTIFRGFIAVRDMATPIVGIEDAIDSGVIPGPPVYPSGTLISQTCGYGDFARAFAWPKPIGGHFWR
jgi:imidazolonepropionase-like amidohydrolase